VVLASERILVIVDSFTSALGIAAQSRAKLDTRFKVIAALDHITPSSLIRAIRLESPSHIIFSWRFLLLEILKSKRFTQKLNQLPSKPLIGVVIADYLGRDPKYRDQEEVLLNSIDFFLVTCKDLESLYSCETYMSGYAGILYDFPNTTISTFLIGDAINPKVSKVMWIGNSKWGQRQGYTDHKGYNSIVLPLFELLEQKYPDIERVIVDSGVKKVANSKILELLDPETILVQASKSEGTGMPVLEALSKGSTPVTTCVGVAKEILTKDFEFLIVEPDANQFYKVICKIIESGPPDSNELQNILRNHLDENFKAVFPFTVETKTPLTSISGNHWMVISIWFSRFALNKARIVGKILRINLRF
jgi:hypothetical protein